MLDPGRRQDVEELLDMPDASGSELNRSLSDLELANRLLGGRRAVARHLLPLAGDGATFLDVGCGSADMLRWLSDFAQARHAKIILTGIDSHSGVVEIAHARCRDYPNIQIAEANALALPFCDQSFDVVLSSTFLHHLDPEDAVRAISEMRRVARRRVVISDLVRGWLGRVGVVIVGRTLFGKMSRIDGSRSFLRAYSPSELADLAERAGLTGVRVLGGAVRMILIWDREICDEV